MKNCFLTLLGLFFAFSAFSQITIEETDLMEAGDTFLIHVDINPLVTPDLSPGEDFTWDFTGLSNDQTNYATYSPNDDLEFIDEFPLSQFHTYGPGFIYAGPGGGAPLDNWGYMMSYTNSTGLYVEGFYSDYGMGYRSTFNSPAELLMPVPFTYSGNESNVSYWEVIVDENAMDYDTLYRRDINKELDAEAWGSITTDYGTFDVIRVHETGISTDSIFAYVGAVTYGSEEVTRDTINKHYFWAKDVKNPVLTVHCDYEGNIERIDYLMDAIYTENITNPSSNLVPQVYPNPANNYFVLENFQNKIEVINYNGQIIKIIDNPGISEVISATNLNPGIYLIRDNINTIKVQIIK
jgi:hypothetical protein